MTDTDTKNTPTTVSTDPDVNYASFVARRQRRALRRFLERYEPAWARALDANGYVWPVAEFPPERSHRTVLNNLYRARAILTKEPTLRAHVPLAYDLSGLSLMPVAEGIFIAPRAERVRLSNNRALLPVDPPPPTNVVMFDDRKAYLAFVERARLDPLYLSENDVNVQCRNLVDCAQVMSDMQKLGAIDSTVREDLMLVLVIKSKVTSDEFAAANA